MHLERDVVAERIAAGKVGVGRLQFQPGQRQARHPTAETKCSGASPAAQVKDALAGLGRAGRCQKHRVGGGAVAPDRLQQGQLAAEEPVVGKLGLGKHQRSGRMSLSRRMAVARK